MPKIRKKTSNRGTTHKRAKLRGKIAEGRKKNKRDAKKNPQWKSKNKKDPGIPNNYPFKEEILAEVQRERTEAEEKKRKRKEDHKAQKAADSNPEHDEKSQELEGAIGSEPQQATSTDDVPPLRDTRLPNLQAVIEEADVILEVLDARDPYSYRSKSLEETILSKTGKTLAFILNKVELVPRESIVQWTAALREERVVIGLGRSKDSQVDSTPVTGKKQSSGSVSNEKVDINVDALKCSLVHWATAKALHSPEPLRVATVGLVNSGKSTIINSLAPEQHLPTYDRAKPKPGFSTTSFPIRVTITIGDHHIEIIDTPGIMKDNHSITDQLQLARVKVRDMLLRNRGQVDRVKDSIGPVEYIVSRAASEDLMLLYNVPAFPAGNTNAFLRAFARVKSCQKKGEPDLERAARIVLKDWSLNRLPYYSLPAVADGKASTSGNSSKFNETDLQILSELGSKFDPILTAGATTTRALWKEGGVVQLTPETIDDRRIIMDTLPSTDEPDSEPKSADSSIDEDGAPSAEESGSEHDSEEEEEESSADEAPPPSKKRQRVGQSAAPSAKSKRVAFVDPLPPKTKAKKTNKTMNNPGARIANGGKQRATSKGQSQPGKGESYDFSKFF